MESFILDNTFLFITIIIIIAIWDIVWRLLAMWKSARRSQIAWFVVLGIFSTAGILPIIYLLIYRKKGFEISE